MNYEKRIADLESQIKELTIEVGTLIYLSKEHFKLIQNLYGINISIIPESTNEVES